MFFEKKRNIQLRRFNVSEYRYLLQSASIIGIDYFYKLERHNIIPLEE